MEKDFNEKLTDTFNGVPNGADSNLDAPDLIFDDESFIDDILNDSDLIARAATLSQTCKAKWDYD